MNTLRVNAALFLYALTRWVDAQDMALKARAIVLHDRYLNSEA